MKLDTIAFVALIVSYSLYNIIGVLLSNPSGLLTVSTIIIYILICLVYLIKTFLSKHINYVKIWMLFLLINVLSFLFIPERNLSIAYRYDFSVISIFRIIFVVLLSFFPFYYLAKKRIISDKTMRAVFLIFFVVNVIGYIYESRLMRMIGDQKDQVNAIYGLVYLIPYIYFLKRKTTVYIVLVLFYLLVISSLKRGALMTVSLGSIVLLYWASMNNLYKASRSKKIYSVLIVLLCIISIYVLISSNDDMINRLNNIEEDGGSGRNLIYLGLLRAWPINAEFSNFIFGYGFAGTVIFVYTLAHNDWLEVAVNYGLIGLLVYILLWRNLFKIFRKLDKFSMYKYCLLSILLMWFVDSMYDRFFSGSYATTTVMVVGYIVGRYELMLNNSYKRGTNSRQESLLEGRN